MWENRGRRVKTLTRLLASRLCYFTRSAVCSLRDQGVHAVAVMSSAACRGRRPQTVNVVTHFSWPPTIWLSISLVIVLEDGAFTPTSCLEPLTTHTHTHTKLTTHTQQQIKSLLSLSRNHKLTHTWIYVPVYNHTHRCTHGYTHFVSHTVKYLPCWFRPDYRPNCLFAHTHIILLFIVIYYYIDTRVWQVDWFKVLCLCIT